MLAILWFLIIKCLRTLFSIKNVFFGIALGIALYSIRSTEKGTEFYTDFFVIFCLVFSLGVMMMRAIKPYILRLMVTGLVMAIAYQKHPFYWGTLAIATVVNWTDSTQENIPCDKTLTTIYFGNIGASRIAQISGKK